MREIKCKAWNRVTKRMWWFDVTWGNTANAGEGWIGMLESPTTPKRTPNGNDNRVQVDGDDCDIVFFTGLKDKNEVEIYEGDILQHEGGRVCQVINFISPMHSGFNLKLISGDTRSNRLYKALWDGQEIIGNIYENGDLLNKVD